MIRDTRSMSCRWKDGCVPHDDDPANYATTMPWCSCDMLDMIEDGTECRCGDPNMVFPT